MGAGLRRPHADDGSRVLARFTTEERSKIGVHTCPGGDCDSTHSADVSYNDLIPSLLRINAGYFLMQLSTEKSREDVYKFIGQNLRKDADGVKQVGLPRRRRMVLA